MTIRFRSLLVAVPLIVAGMATPAGAQYGGFDECVLKCRQDYAGNNYMFQMCRNWCISIYYPDGPIQAAPVPLATLD